MRSRSYLILSSVALSGFVLLFSVRNAQSGQGGGLARLQSTSPGVAQAGNMNISGTSIAGAFQAPYANFAGASNALNVSNSADGSALIASANSGFGRAAYFSSTGGGGQGIYVYSTQGYNAGEFQFGGINNAALRGTAYTSNGSAYGGWFSSAATSGGGVVGEAYATTGFTYGGYMIADSNSGIGVYGLSVATSGGTHGGYFEDRSPGGQGLHAVNIANPGTTYGVVGEVFSGGGYGIYSLGRFASSGTKSFRIDHPFDPTHKYLLHYSAEGPDPLDIYQGRARTDDRGYATVDLPNYFEAINRNPEYVLTVIDDSDDFVQVKVAREVRGNQFIIRSSKPRVSVSWEVKAIRNDLWVKKHGAPVVEDKVGDELGRVQHPDLYDGKYPGLSSAMNR